MGEGTVALNRKARHEFHIEETFQAGLVLYGHGDQVDPFGKGQPPGRLRPRRAGRSLDLRHAHRAVRDREPLEP